MGWDCHIPLNGLVRDYLKGPAYAGFLFGSSPVLGRRMRSGTLCIAQLGLRSVAVLESRIIMPSSEKPTVWVGGLSRILAAVTRRILCEKGGYTIGQTYETPMERMYGNTNRWVSQAPQSASDHLNPIRAWAQMVRRLRLPSAASAQLPAS